MKIDELAYFYKALAEPARLRILGCLLAVDDICVCDLMRLLDQPQSFISRHLAYLRKHGLAQSERRGTWQYYRHALTPMQARQVQALAQEVEELRRLQSACADASSCCEPAIPLNQ